MASGKATNQRLTSCLWWLIVLRTEHVSLARSLLPSSAVYLPYKGESVDLRNKQLIRDKILANFLVSKTQVIELF